MQPDRTPSAATSYRKRPVVIEARQIGNDYDEDVDIMHWCGGDPTDEGGGLFYLETLEGRMLARPDDWIVKGVQGEFYPVKPGIFEESYEEVEAP